MGGERMGRNGQSLAAPAVIAKQQAECYQLQLDGLSIREIAKRTGLSVGTVHNRINAQCEAVAPALEPLVPSLAEQVRARHLEQIVAWLVKLNDQIERDLAVARNVEVGTRLLEREAKLLGIDAPQQVQATVTQVTQEDIALAELVREAQAAAAVAEQQLRKGSAP
jgi:transposase